MTKTPLEVVACIQKDLKMEEPQLKSSQIYGDQNKQTRDSKNAWISTVHWISGFLWSYVQKANRENFCYDINHFDDEAVQYTRYDVGQHYNWHCDSLHNGPTRKLSVTMQLSMPCEYEGGELEFVDANDEIYTAPKELGTVIIFDSRAKHRVKEVTKGTRRSLVGWAVGPNWR